MVLDLAAQGGRTRSATSRGWPPRRSPMGGGGPPRPTSTGAPWRHRVGCETTAGSLAADRPERMCRLSRGHPKWRKYWVLRWFFLQSPGRRRIGKRAWSTRQGGRPPLPPPGFPASPVLLGPRRRNLRDLCDRAQDRARARRHGTGGGGLRKVRPVPIWVQPCGRGAGRYAGRAPADPRGGRT